MTYKLFLHKIWIWGTEYQNSDEFYADFETVAKNLANKKVLG